MTHKIGVLLAGCGVIDGSEIHESVLTLLAIDNAGAQAVCMAPDIEQAHVINHLTGKPVEGERRNCLEEAARIARGKIRDLAEVKASEIDALIIPGGFGVAKNLCDYATQGAQMAVLPDVARLIDEMRAARKPVGAICIAPVVIASVAGKDPGAKPTLTIGSDETTAGHVEALGASHVACPVREFVVDREHKLVTTPAYMLAKRVGEAAVGIEKLVGAVIELI